MLSLPIMILPVDRLNPLCERFLASLRDEETLFLAFPCSPFTARSVKSRAVSSNETYDEAWLHIAFRATSNDIVYPG